MTAARDRADRKGSTPIQIGATKLTTDGSDNLSVTNASGTPKKLIASEIEIGDSSNKVIIKKGSDNKVAFQTQASGGSAADSNAGAVTVYANISAMTSASASAGDQALVTANSGLYVHNGGGWYKVATVNTSPTISSPSNGANITLATDGTATSIELTGADVDEGTTLQNSYAVTTGSLTNGGGATATITSSATSGGTYSALAASTNTTNRFFKITPTTNTSYSGTFSLTFSMSDGISAATTVQNFTLVFAVNGSTAFDGSGDTLTMSASSDFTMGTGDFTVECFYNATYDITGSTNKYMFDIGGNNLRVKFHNAVIKASPVAGENVSYTPSGSDLTGWHHLALVRNGSSFTFYFDGVSKGSLTTSSNHSTNTIKIGGYDGNTSYDWGAGFISNFRIVKGTAVYTSNFTPSTSPLTAISGTTLLTCFNPSGTITDSSSSSHSITANGDVAASSSHPF